MFVLEKIKEYAKTNYTAAVSRDGNLSFAELDRRSNAFAYWLLKRFGNSCAPVMIYGQKERDFLPCMFGALKAGCAYVPVDSAIPRGRAAEIAGDIRPDIVIDFCLAEEDAGTEIWREVPFVADKDTIYSILNKPFPSEISRENWVAGEDTAYILFTSGSTGKPKGVPITAANIECFYRGILPFMGDDAGIIFDQVSYSFDVSCCSIYAGLACGKTLMSVERELSENLGAMFDFLRGSGLTMWVSTPSFAEICVRAAAFNEALLPNLQTFLFCGEVLTNKLCDELARRFPNAKILNTYGPTEATVLVSAVYITPKQRSDTRPVPIGYPIEGVTLRLEDDNGAEVKADGTPGELLIIGGSVSSGYINRLDLNTQRFFTDSETGQRGYRTGDICSREEGLYYYQGRRDNQIKLHGYRVEIEDIEIALAKAENISQAVVIPEWQDGKVQYLAAFIQLCCDDGFTSLKRTIAIKKSLAELLPAYMIPRKFIVVDCFPLNINGKVDRKELQKRLDEA